MSRRYFIPSLYAVLAMGAGLVGTHGVAEHTRVAWTLIGFLLALSSGVALKTVERQERKQRNLPRAANPVRHETETAA